jgi:two-component system, chemotaxis family, protein-glutamate methylesterase/glutaminase
MKSKSLYAYPDGNPPTAQTHHSSPGGCVANRDLVVIGASAGGIEALQQLCAGLPADLNAAVLVVMHTSNHSGGLLPKVLSRAGPLPATHPEDGELLQNGHVYVAPGDLHMLAEPGMLRVVRGPRENRHRPAIDPTFRSAAVAYGRRVIGVVLTGMLDDGTAGLMVIRSHGGAAVVQNPHTAMFPSMPQSALLRVPDARVAELPEIPKLLVELVSEELKGAVQPIPWRARHDKATDREVRIAGFDMSEIENDNRNGKPSQFACPECGGVLWEIDQSGSLRYRCRVGHAYTARHLRAEQRQAVEAAMWSALRALEENASLYKRMAERSRNGRQDQSASIFEERAANAEANSATLRNFLVQVSTPEADLDDIAESF